MNSHLSSEQLDGVLSGELSEQASAHLGTCAQCSEEVIVLRQAFGNLREATSAAAENHRRFVATASSRRIPRMAWALGTVALLVSITSPVAMHRRTVTPVVVQKPVAPITISDEALLDSVQNDLSASVPASLLPLAGTSTSSTNATSQLPTKEN